MELNVDTASARANSYGTVAESRKVLSSVWQDLDPEKQNFRLILAAKIIDSLTFRGIKATKAQSLQFPRLLPGSLLYVEDSDGKPIQFTDWQTLTEYAALKNAPLPVIPEDVKAAQFEIADQLVTYLQAQCLATIIPQIPGLLGKYLCREVPPHNPENS